MQLEENKNHLYKNFDFKVTKLSSFSHARLGELSTPHGSFKTPAFIFCATKASVKNLISRDFEEEKTQIILANTYHLMLNGGADLCAKGGGLASVMNWSGPTLTDSGGFQVFSFGHGLVANEIKGSRETKRPSMIANIKKDGVIFKSYIDGSKQLLTPERSIETQRKIGADLILVFDECTPFNVPKEYTEKSMHLSHHWEERSFQYFEKHNDQTQALYGIIQGGVYEDLRKISAEFVHSLPFFGIAIGGCLGQNKKQMYEITSLTMKTNRESSARERPVHLLGIGSIADIFFGVEQGIDTFDCVHPTRIARHGCAIVSFERFREIEYLKGDSVTKKSEEKNNKEFISLKNSFFKNYLGPIDEKCECYTCRHYSCAYLNYLIKADENSFMSMLSIHNIRQMNKLMEEIRSSIASSSEIVWNELKKKWVGC